MVSRGTQLECHAACSLFPELPEDELQALVDDIKARGLLNPIVLYQGKVLDGRNRYRACQLANVEPRFVDWEPHGSPVEYVISQNLMRRHLSSSQRAAIALEVLPLLEQQAKERQQQSPGRGGKKVAQKQATFSGKASGLAARLLKTNRTYVERAKSIQKQAPELIEELKAGKLKVPDATKIAKLPQTERQRILHAMQNGKAKSQRTAVAGNENRSPYDFYSTPPEATQALLDREDFEGQLFEPASGAGAMVDVLREAGYEVIATDIQTGTDFRTAAKLRWIALDSISGVP